MYNIVLDIDSTLVQTFESIDSLYTLIDTTDDLNHLSHQTYCFDVVDPESDGTNEPYYMWGIDRPYLQEFISYCIENFKNVYIWSAGTKKYVEKIVEHIFPRLDYHPPIILDYNDTIYNEEENIVTKPLQMVYNKSNGEADETNTFSLDDREDTFSENPRNGILIPRFAFDDRSIKEDGQDKLLNAVNHFVKNDKCLYELINFFENNKNVEDVRTLDMTGIFTTCSKMESDMSDRFIPKNSTKLSPSHNIHQ